MLSTVVYPHLYQHLNQELGLGLMNAVALSLEQEVKNEKMKQVRVIVS